MFFAARNIPLARHGHHAYHVLWVGLCLRIEDDRRCIGLCPPSSGDEVAVPHVLRIIQPGGGMGGEASAEGRNARPSCHANALTPASLLRACCRFEVETDIFAMREARQK